MHSVALCQENSTRKHYTGPLEVAGLNGIADYYYYEDNETYERIYDGIFKFTVQKKFGTITISGDNKDGKAEGLWKSEATLVDSDNKLNISTEINFSNGFPDGSFKLRAIDTKSGKTARTESIDCSFTKGILTGNLNYELKNNSKFTNRDGNLDGGSATGNFDKNGYLNGTWKFTYYNGKVKHNRIVDYKNGFVLKIIETNDQSGEIIYQKDNNKEYNSFISCYNDVSQICLKENTFIENGSANFLTGEINNLHQRSFSDIFIELGAKTSNVIFTLPSTKFYENQPLEKQIATIPLNMAIDSTGKLFELGEFSNKTGRTGNWTIFFDKDGLETHSTLNASYYLIIEKLPWVPSEWDKTSIKQYYITGELFFQGQITDLKRWKNGDISVWINKNGIIKNEGRFKDSYLGEECKFYYKNGNIVAEGKFGIPSDYPTDCTNSALGKKNGKWKEYDKDGNLITTITYKCGEEIKRK